MPDLNRPHSISLSQKRMSSLLSSARSMFFAVLNFMIFAPLIGKRRGSNFVIPHDYFLNARNSENIIDDRKDECP